MEAAAVIRVQPSLLPWWRMWT